MSAAGIETGARFAIRVDEPFTRERIAEYARASGDVSRIHLDDAFARRSGLDGIIVHGVFVLSVMVESVLARFAPDAHASVVDARFGRPFPEGDRLVIDGEVTAWRQEPGRRVATVGLVGRNEGEPEARPCVTGEVQVVVPD